MNKIAIIGGSRLASLENFSMTHSTTVNTPYGEPSAPLNYGMLGDKEVVFLPRRGSHTPMAPHKINFRANIWALRDAGVQTIIATAAVGGLATNYQIGDLVLPDQLIDFTHGRESTFFGEDDDEITQVDFTAPYSESLRQQAIILSKQMKIHLYESATYAITQGPRYETHAEAQRLARDGCDIVGMTGMPEATLARELGLEYALIAIVTRMAGKTATDNEQAQHEIKVSQGEKQLANLIEQLIIAT